MSQSLLGVYKEYVFDTLLLSESVQGECNCHTLFPAYGLIPFSISGILCGVSRTVFSNLQLGSLAKPINIIKTVSEMCCVLRLLSLCDVSMPKTFIRVYWKSGMLCIREADCQESIPF